MQEAGDLLLGPRQSAAIVTRSADETDRLLCCHQIIQNHAVRAPASPAVFDRGLTLTYAELDSRAEALARRLRAQGAGPGSLIGISIRRSAEMVVGLLGIMKAGAAYVPLDPRLPEERLNFLVSDARLQMAIVSGTPLAEVGLPVLDLHATTPEDGWAPGMSPPDISCDDLVYVIYTSGSTGQPKGAMVPHRGLVNWLVWMRSAWSVTPADVVLAKAPLGFDVSAWELFLPLISGALLVLADSDRQYDPHYLAGLMSETRVSIAQFVPSLMRLFLELDELPDLGALRHVMCGGEVLTPRLQSRFFARLPNAEICNSYGPTECSIGVTRWVCRPGDERASVPIGYAIDNTELYILDSDLNPVSPGVAGELYIGGTCVGWGYVNRPDLTAERFIPDPFRSDGQGRMYRTGDLCRQLDDGSIDFLGRADDQVKVRGVRIELGEIENALLQHPSVEIAAAATEQHDGEKILCAYVVPAGGSALSERALRGFLLAKLPLAMVPSEFLFVPSLPLSANGKIDRKRLAELREPAVAPASAGPSPAASDGLDDIERRVVELWRDVLRISDFSRRDDFFACGGDSLSAIDLVMRLESTFKCRIDFDLLLNGLTVETIADAVRHGTPAPARKPGPKPASPAVRERAGPDTFIRLASFEDVPGIFPVCQRAFPPYATASAEEFRELCAHRWLDNPFRTEADPFGWVLETGDGRIVGFHGLVPTPLWVDGQGVVAVSPTTWATDPGHGQAGLALLSAYMGWGSDRFLLNTTANAITSRMHESGAFGMQRIPLRNFDQRLVWMLDFKSLVRWKAGQAGAPALLRSRLGAGVVEGLLAAAAPFVMGLAGGGRAGLTAGLRGMRIAFKCRPLDLTPVEEFGPEFDDLWDRLKHRYTVTVERTARLLNWRHRSHVRLLGPSSALACRGAGGEPLGYVAWREPVTTAPGHVIITDLFFDETQPDVLENLMNGVFAAAASRSASVLELFGFHPELDAKLYSQRPYVFRRSQLERLGRGKWAGAALAAFDRRGRDVLSSTYWYRAPSAEADAACAEGSWWPSGIDGDLNL